MDAAQCRVGAELGGYAWLRTTSRVSRPAAGPATPGSRGLVLGSGLPPRCIDAAESPPAMGGSACERKA